MRNVTPTSAQETRHRAHRITWAATMPLASEPWRPQRRRRQGFSSRSGRAALAQCRSNVERGDILRSQAVALPVGHQQAWLCRIPLDLLPQTIHMGLERMCGYRGIVAPDLVQQFLALHDAVSGAMQESKQ